MFIKLLAVHGVMDDKGWIVVSLGGSIIVPEGGINVEFLRGFTGLVRQLIDEGYRFVLITGGGSTCRHYQQAAREICDVSDEDLDWLGVHATRLNGHLIRTLFRDVAASRIVTDPEQDELPEGEHRILVGAGWKPGWSTDYDAAILARRLGARRLVNLSNVPYIYAADPRVNPDAERFKRIDWDKLRSIIGDEWSPGKHVPFDPVAARLCQESGIEVALLAVHDLENVRAAMKGQEFQGTRIN